MNYELFCFILEKKSCELYELSSHVEADRNWFKLGNSDVAASPTSEGITAVL
jgi:hypothetical protein